MLSKIILTLATAEFVEDQTLNAFEIVLIGFSFVFFILLVLSFTTSILGKVFARIPVGGPSSPIAAGTATASEKSLVLSKGTGDDFNIEESGPHYIAIIAAAIHCAMDGREHRIVSIRSSNSA